MDFLLLMTVAWRSFWFGDGVGDECWARDRLCEGCDLKDEGETARHCRVEECVRRLALFRTRTSDTLARLPPAPSASMGRACLGWGTTEAADVERCENVSEPAVYGPSVSGPSKARTSGAAVMTPTSCRQWVLRPP